MISAPTLSEANANLVQTYLRLGRAAPGASTWERGKLLGCVGEFDHPICNFAVAAAIESDDVEELVTRSRSRERFQIYVPGGPSSSSDQSFLLNAGFKVIYKLTQMAASPLHEVPGINPAQATTHAARFAVARFMVDLFFGAQPRSHRDVIAQATASAEGLDLYVVGYQDRMVASVMLCREGKTLGIYNLCVMPDVRNQGWGRAVLDWARVCAGNEGRTLTLQCDPGIAPWYSRAGFCDIGETLAFSRGF